MGNQRISDLTPIQSGSLAKNANVIPVVSGNETYQTTLTDLQSDLSPRSLQVSGSTTFSQTVILPGAWSAGGALSSPRYRLAGAGEKTSALAFGGYAYPDYTMTGATEAYDGTSWSAQNSMIQSRNNLGGAGTQNAAIAVGGNNEYYPTNDDQYSCTEEYDGTSWTAGGALIRKVSGQGTTGTQNATLSFGGYNADPIYCESTFTEEYNGTAWSAGGNLNSSRYSLAGVGTQNSALAFGGATDNNPTLFYIGCTEAYDGTSWSAEAGTLSCARYYLKGAGTQNSALAFGGAGDDCFYVPDTERWDGTSWTTDAPLSNGRYMPGGAGSTTGNAAAFGGINYDVNSPYFTACTEEYTDGPITYRPKFIFTTQTGDISATGSFTGIVSATSVDVTGNVEVTGSLISNGDVTFGKGLTVNSTASFYGGVTTKSQFNFNSSALSQGPNKIGGTGRGMQGTGIQEAALMFGSSVVCQVNCTEEFDGSSWSVGGTLINGRAQAGAAGTQNASLAMGGYTRTPTSPFNTPLSSTEEYDGTTWSSGGTLIAGRCFAGSGGTQNSSIIFGGKSTSPVLLYYRSTEKYDGSTWSTDANMNIGGTTYGDGTQSDALGFASCNSIQQNELYDGTTWSVGTKFVYDASYGQSYGTIGTLAGSTSAAISALQGSQLSRNCMTLAKFNGISWVTDLNYNYGFGGNRDGAIKTPNIAIAGNSLTGIMAGGYCVGNNTTLYTEYGLSIPVSATFSGTNNGNLKTSTFGNSTISSDLTTRNSINIKEGNLSITNLSGSVSINTLETDPILGTSLSGGTKLKSKTGEVSSWSEGSPLLYNRTSRPGGAGVKNATIITGGWSGVSPYLNSINNDECYDGVAWNYGKNTTIINPPFASQLRYITQFGTQTDSIVAGGEVCAQFNDGTTYKVITGPTYIKTNPGSAGTTQAGLVFGSSYTPSLQACTEEYNGTTWSDGGPLNVGRSSMAGLGTQNAALAAGGSPANRCTEAYDGSTWSVCAATISCRLATAGTGTQNDAFIFGGFGNILPSERFNGTAWSADCNLTIPFNSHASSGTSLSALAMGGTNPTSTICFNRVNEYSCTATTETTFEHTDTGRLVFSQISSSLDFASDSAAAAGGVPLGGIYRNGGDIKIRLV